MSEPTNYFHYEPNVTLTYVGCAAFGCVSLFFLIQTVRYRAWYFLPFLLGCINETAGYGARRLAADKVDQLGLYIAQGLLLLLPPAFFSATIYMLLKRIITVMEGQEYSRLSPRLLTKVFVSADVVSLFLQAAGGGLQGSKKATLTKVGQYTTILGLVVQVLAFSWFLFLTHAFAVSMARVLVAKGVLEPWKRCVYAIYVSGVLILLRSVYRVVEYAMGHGGYLMTHEVYFYALDTLPMFLTALVFVLVFPPAQLERQAALNGEKIKVRQAVQQV